MTLLAINNLSISFGASHVVKNVSLSVARGEIVAIVGESGSGKSLTAHAILKLLPATAKISGAIHFTPSLRGAEGDAAIQTPKTGSPHSARDGEQNLLTATESEITSLRGSRVGMIFQEPMTALNPLHTIDRQIIEPWLIHQKNRTGLRSSRVAVGEPLRSARGVGADHHTKTRLNELYAAVGLGHLATRGKLYPHQLSGGERQRAMIAMAIANDPDLLIADEPTTALDVALQQQILHLLKSLQKERGMGMVFITHDLLAVREIADRVIVMRAGEIVEQNTTEALFKNPAHAYTKMLLAAAPHGVADPLKPNAPTVLACENLSVNFPVKSPILRRTLRVVQAVKNVSFTLRAGETLGIVGESGSGKSTLAYALLRLAPSEGKIVFLGNRIDTLNTRSVRPHRAAMQLVFQDPYGSLNPRMTVGEIIAEGLHVHEHSTPTRASRVASHGAPEGGGAVAGARRPLRASAKQKAIEDAVDEILTQVGLDTAMKHRYPHEFSGGQRQRIAIARAMILKPKLVVLDEPTSALDMSVQKQVLELLKSLQKSHDVAYLFISHDLRVIRSVAHQVLVLKRGDVVEHGDCETLFTAPKHDYTKALLAAALGN